MLGWIHEKMATQKSALGGGRFLAFGLIVIENGASSCSNSCTLGGDCSTAVGNSLGTTHIHVTCLAGVRGWAKSQVLWCNTHNIWVGTQMAKLDVLASVASWC
jgi:hypothetical protein